MSIASSPRSSDGLEEEIIATHIGEVSGRYFLPQGQFIGKNLVPGCGMAGAHQDAFCHCSQVPHYAPIPTRLPNRRGAGFCVLVRLA